MSETFCDPSKKRPFSGPINSLNDDDLDRSLTSNLDADILPATALTDDDLDRSLTTNLNADILPATALTIDDPDRSMDLNAPSLNNDDLLPFPDNNIVLHQKFNSYKEFTDALEAFEKKNFVCFSKRDSRKVESIRHKVSYELNPELIYYEMKYVCIKGGPLCLKGQGKRKTSTCKTDCPAFISIRATQNGKQLEIKAVNLIHNHEISEVLFRHLPQQRKLPDDTKNKAKELLSLDANKKLLQQKLQNETGLIVTLKDLSNLSREPSELSNDLTEAVKFLQNKYEADVEVLKDGDDNFQGAVFQTNKMKKMFASYPEFLAFDGTYNLLNTKLTTFVFLVEDGDTKSQIVGIALAANEMKNTLNWVVETFKKKNTASSSTKLIMTDKDLTERSVFRDHFGSADLLLCTFHCLRTFGREITCEKYTITSAQRTLFLQVLQKMVTSLTEAEFLKYEEKFMEIVPKNVRDYYIENWSNLKAEWCKGIQAGKGNFLNSTNNRVESINQKIKSTVKRNSTLLAYLEKLMAVITCLEDDRFHKGIMMMHKRNIVKSHGVFDDYSDLLTHSTFKLVEKELKAFEEKNYSVFKKNDDDQFTVTSSLGELNVTSDSCECPFQQGMQLPCRHIFTVRQSIALPIFEPNLVNKRWTKQYYLSCLTDEGNDRSFVNRDVTVSTCNASKPKSVQEKRKKIVSMTNKIADFAASSNEKYFEHVIDFLKLLEKKIANQEELSFGNAPQSNAVKNFGTELEQATIFDHNYASHNNVQTSALPSVPADPVPSTSAGCVLDSSIDSSACYLSCPAVNILSNSENVHANLATVKMPLVLKKRGRPKGSDLNVIGLPKKKKSSIKEAVPFIFLPLEKKEYILLECFVDPERVITANMRLIEEEEVNVMPSNVSTKIVDKNVDVKIIKKYFTCDAWKAVEQVVATKEKCPNWLCNVCRHELSKNKSIGCDGCLEWYHLCCISMKKIPKKKYWFCPLC